MQNPQSILITGASSGIGEALALEYARSGVNLILNGRDEARLEMVAGAVRARGASATIEAADVTDRDAMTAMIDRCDTARPLDLVIANAGVSLRMRSLADLDQVTRKTFAANVDGVFNTLHPAIARMAPRRRGQLAIVSSIAGFRGLPGAAAYSASKAAVKAYGEGLRVRLAREGLALSVICPGYVRSPMTDKNRYRMPFLMDADRAARIIREGLARNQSRIAFPWPMYALIRLVSVLPPALVDWVAARTPDQ